MPEDQVAKRGTTVQLECRVKHDPSLKLTVSWLKDDEPLYISNRSPLLPPCLLLPGALPSPLILVMCGCTQGSYVGVSLQNRRRGFWTPQGRSPPMPALSPLSALLLSPLRPPLLPSSPPFSPPSSPPSPPSSICALFSVPLPLLVPLQRPSWMPPASFQPSQQCLVPRQRRGCLSRLWPCGYLACPYCTLGPRLSSPSARFGSDWS